MIILFNSGFRELYRLNVLNTLHLPPGGENIYRYSSRPGYDYVDPAVKQLARAQPFKEAPCMVVFVDRTNTNAFRFLPLRIGWVTSISAQDQQYRFAVRLDRYLHTPTPERFTEAILQLCGEDVPHRLEDDHAVGYFARVLEDADQLGTLVDSSPTSWATTVDTLLALPCFDESAGTNYVFTKLEYINSLAPPTWYEGSDNTVSLSYRCHDDGSPSARMRELELMMPGTCVTVSPFRILLSGAYDTVPIGVHVPILPSAIDAQLLMRRRDESPIALADRGTSIHVKKRVWNQVLGSFYLIMFAVASAVLFMKSYEIPEILSCKGLVTIACIVLQVLLLAAISFRMGRPIK